MVGRSPDVRVDVDKNVVYPRAGETLSLRSGRDRTLVVVVDRRRFQCDGGLGIFPSRIAACQANVAMTMADCFRSSSFMRSG